jgi:formate transporter
MTAKQPPEIAEAAVETGVKKAHLRWDKVFVGSFLAGAYIAFGGLVAITVSSGLDTETWGRSRRCSWGRRSRSGWCWC